MSDADEKWQWVDEDPIERLLAASGPQARAAQHFDLAVRLQQAEAWQAAADSYRMALKERSGHTGAWAGLGSCLLHLDAAEEALHCFERMVEAGGDRQPAMLGTAVALQKLDRHEEAGRIYRALLQVNPDSADALANLIALSAACQDAESVSEYSTRLLRIEPQSKAALQGLAMVAMRNGDRAAAVEYCTRLVEVDPDSFEGWSNLRYAQQKMRPPGQAARSIA